MREPDGPVSAEQILANLRRYQQQRKREATMAGLGRLVGFLVSVGLVAGIAGYGWTLGVRLAGG